MHARAGRAHDVRWTSALRRPERSVDSRPSRLYVVSNRLLRVVRSLLNTIQEGGIVMGEVRCNLTVFFEDPFWVGIFEVIDEGKLAVSKVTFGAEPKDYDIYELIKEHFYDLQFSPAVTTVVKETRPNPKRMQRDAKKMLQEKGIGTKSQQALKLQQEQNKQERKTKSREQKLAEEERMFELKQQKKKEKRRGR